MKGTKRAPLAGLRNDKLNEKVRRALPLARTLLTRGVGDLDGGKVGDSDHLPGYVAQLIVYDGPHYPDADHGKFEDSMSAAYALGIAIGLHMRLDVFTGGAK